MKKILLTLLLTFTFIFNVKSQVNKQVGIAYSPWHPNAVWPDGIVAANVVCAWAKPKLGYYKSDNIAVIDQHTDWLTDAGIDFVTMDWSNNCGTQNQWLEVYTAVFVDRQVWRKNNGLPYLLTAVMIGCPFDEASNTDGRMSAEVDVVKTNYIDHPTRGAVYYKHRGKPLVVVYQNGNWNYNSWDHSKFDATITIRNMFATLVQNPNMHDPKTMRAVNGLWSWSENVHPPAYAFDGRPEFMSAHAALRTCGWWGPESYNQVDAGLKSCIDTWGGAKGRRNGATLRESFGFATKYDVDVVQVMAFNEWTGCENNNGEQRNQEYSNDIEPMEGGHGDLYLKIMKEEIFKFKGWDINNPPNASPKNYWHFTSSMEGWTPVNQMTATASNSIATATITGSDPSMHSPDNLNISATEYKYVVVSMQNQTASTTAELFWSTTTATGYDGAKMVQFPIVANDTKQRYYIIDLTANPNWTGTIKQLRFDPTTTVTSGTTKIDFIKFVGSFQSALAAIPGTLEAEKFNKGGQNNAYNDADVVNNGGAYRTTEGVDIETTGDATGAYNVGWVAAGEWMEYLVTVTQTGTYNASVRAAAPGNGAALELYNDGDLLSTITLTNSGAWQTYANTLAQIQLTQGKHILKIRAATNGYNLNFISFAKYVPSITPYTQINGGTWTQTNTATLCAGGSVSFGPQPADGTWSWTGPNSFTANTRIIDFTSITTAKSGTYTAKYTDANGNTNTQAFTLTVNALPTATISTTTPTTFCQGGSVLLTASTGTSYKWFNGTTQVGTAATYTATNSGSYTVEVTNASGCKATSATKVVTVNALPTATISTTTPLTFCQGGSVLLTASAGASYKWFNGTAQVGTSATYTANAAGSYTVEVTSASGCKATSTATVVAVNDSPSATVKITEAINGQNNGSITFTFTDNVSRSNIAFSTDDGTTYTGVADNTGSYTFKNLAAGSYKLWTRWGNAECPVSLGSFTIMNNITTAIASIDETNRSFIAYPNPANDVLNIQVNNLDLGKSISLLDARGLEVLNQKIDTTEFTISLSNMSAGVYVLKVGEKVQKVIISK